MVAFLQIHSLNPIYRCMCVSDNLRFRGLTIDLGLFANEKASSENHDDDGRQDFFEEGARMMGKVLFSFPADQQRGRRVRGTGRMLDRTRVNFLSWTFFSGDALGGGDLPGDIFWDDSALTEEGVCLCDVFREFWHWVAKYLLLVMVPYSAPY